MNSPRRCRFSGRVSCNVDRIEAGSWQEIVIDYEVGASGMADGSWFKATMKFYSDWALFQTSDPAAANLHLAPNIRRGPLVEGQSPATVQALKVRFDQKGHERPFQKAIIVDVVDGYLKAGDHIIIRLGDRRLGGPGTRVQTFVEQDFRIRCYVDPLGTSRFAAVSPDLVMQVEPGPPAQIVWAGSRIVKAGERLPLRSPRGGRLGQHLLGARRRHSKSRRRVGGESVYARRITHPGKGWCVALLEDLPTRQAASLSSPRDCRAARASRPHPSTPPSRTSSMPRASSTPTCTSTARTRSAPIRPPIT